MAQRFAVQQNDLAMYHSYKKGKKFCPDEIIERAFVESYHLLCYNNKDVLNEFLIRTEETLSGSNVSKQLSKVERDIQACELKKAKLVDMRLEETIDKETYESKYLELTTKIELLSKERVCMKRLKQN